jgi:hypothetical protein
MDFQAVAFRVNGLADPLNETASAEKVVATNNGTAEKQRCAEWAPGASAVARSPSAPDGRFLCGRDAVLRGADADDLVDGLTALAHCAARRAPS